MTQPHGSGQPEDNQGVDQDQAPAESTEQPASSEEPEYIYLRADQLHAEIARLERENQDFARLFNTRIGDKAARQYKPQIQEREQQIEELQRELRCLDILSMDEDEIEEKFASDPEFAREYAELVHYQPSRNQPDETEQITSAVNEAFDWARSMGLDERTIGMIQNKAANAEYDREGEPWTYSLQRMQQDLAQQLINQKSSNNGSNGSTNPSLTKGGNPDLTPSNRKRGSAAVEVPKTIAEFKALPVSRQNEILDDPEGMAAVERLAQQG